MCRDNTHGPSSPYSGLEKTAGAHPIGAAPTIFSSSPDRFPVAWCRATRPVSMVMAAPVSVPGVWLDLRVKRAPRSGPPVGASLIHALD